MRSWRVEDSVNAAGAPSFSRTLRKGWAMRIIGAPRCNGCLQKSEKSRVQDPAIPPFKKRRVRARALFNHSDARCFGNWDVGSKRGTPDFKCGSAFGTVVAGDLSLVVLDHTIRRAESKAGRFAHRLGGVERIEDALGIAQAGAGVGELHDHFVVFPPERHLEPPAAGFL